MTEPDPIIDEVRAIRWESADRVLDGILTRAGNPHRDGAYAGHEPRCVELWL